MEFVTESYDFDEFARYVRKIGLYKDDKDLEWLKVGLAKKLLNLILWKQGDEIIGHAIWHESNTDEHRGSDPRDEDDKAILRKLLGGKKEFVELHEVWLREEHRGRGHGKQFFEFFEEYMKTTGYDSIIYYAFHPAAITICRRRGYKEAYGIEEAGPFGEKETCYVFYLPINR